MLKILEKDFHRYMSRTTQYHFVRLKPYLVLGFLLLFLESTTQAQTSFSWISEAGYPDGMALAGAQAASGQGHDALAMNPAGMARGNDGRKLTAANRWYPDHINQNSTQLTWAGRTGSVWGLELRRMSYGVFDGYDADGLSAGTYTAADYLIRTGLARQWGSRLSIGGALGGLWSTLADARASAVIWSLGAQLQLPHMAARLGAVIQNRGRMVRQYGSAEFPDELPAAWLVGLSKTLAHLPLTLHVSAGRQAADGLVLWRVGGEFDLPRHLLVRIGVDQGKLDYARGNSQADLLSGLSFGFGIKPIRMGGAVPGFRRADRKISLDGACKLMGPLGTSLSFAIQLLF